MTKQPRRIAGTKGAGEPTFRRHDGPDVTLAARHQAWPSIEWESHLWDTDPDRSASRRKRMQARGPYEAAIPPKIADCDPDLSTETMAMAEAATMEMVRFDAEFGRQVSPFATLLLRSESSSSSEIENLTVGAKKLALAGLGDTSSRNATLVASNVAALRSALRLADDITPSTIATMHQTLLSGFDVDAGRYRQTQVWIGGNSPHTAQFVPPHQDRVPPAMDDVVDFMRREDIPVLAQAAIAHAQFETIHPFTDGNGRTGRAIVSALLRAKEVTRTMTIPVSSGLLTNTRSYFDALEAYRGGRPTPIVERFAESAFAAVENSRLLAESIEAIEADHLDRLRNAPPSARRVAALLLAEPALTADTVAEELAMPRTTVYRALEHLEQAEILKPSGHIHGAQVWIAPEVLDALDAFAVRAGRRVRG